MVDTGTTTTRWRGLNSIKALTSKLNNNGNIKKPVLQERESDLAAYDDVDISLIQTRTYLLSAGIGDTNKQYNKYKGKIGLLVWCINIVIHFSLDFYEAWTIFGTAWATCIGLFFVTLVACCISMIRNSIPWFLRGVKKLKKDGHYPKTLSRVRLLVRVSFDLFFAITPSLQTVMKLGFIVDNSKLKQKLLESTLNQYFFFFCEWLTSLELIAVRLQSISANLVEFYDLFHAWLFVCFVEFYMFACYFINNVLEYLHFFIKTGIAFHCEI